VLLRASVFTTFVAETIRLYLRNLIHEKCKDVPVTSLEGPWGCERSRLPHLLHSLLIDGGKVVSQPYAPAALYPPEDPWYSFLLEAESTQGP
jgi:hypothetical protein